MRTIRTVMNSDTVNRYGMRFTVAALESGLRQAWNPGLPGFISHDRHRPVEWNQATGIYLEPGMARLFGISMFPETSEEAQWVERQCNAALNSKIQEHVAPHIDHMTRCLNPYLSSQAKWMHLECPAVVDDGIAKRLAPELFENADKDGLTFLKDLNPIAPGVFQYGEWAIFAHSFFRRSLSRHNTTNAPFLERLNALQNNELVTARIALDPDVVGLAQEYLEPVELQYWWGPKFDDSIANIPRGVTRHEADEIQRLFHGVSRTEFWWYRQDEFCVFESEEVLDAASLGVSDSFYGCRYVHSMVNAELNVVTHMDGAIRGYDEDTIIKRIDSDIIKAGRRSKYSKLWRVDGELSVEEWKSLLSDFYRDNVLVAEYLGGSDDNFEAHTEIGPELSGNISVLGPGDGVRLAVSYHPRIESILTERSIGSWDTITIGDRVLRVVESHGIDLYKALRKKGLSADWPSAVSRVSYRDRIINLPPVTHDGKNAASAATSTIAVIGELCQAWANRDSHRIVSFNVVVNFKEQQVLVAAAGNVKDVSDFIVGKFLPLPNDINGMGEWLETTASNLTMGNLTEIDRPRLFDLVSISGSIVLPRKVLSADQVEMKKNVDGIDLRRRNSSAIGGEGEDQRLAPVILIVASSCSHCKEAYVDCQCIRVIDKGVQEWITESELLGAISVA